MSSNPTYPGVYIEELPSGIRRIDGVPTSITAFIGRARQGPVNKPVTIYSYSGFIRVFGKLELDSSLGFAVLDFFRNGGQQAIVVRLYHPDPSKSAKTRFAVGEITLEAANEGSWGMNLRGTIDQNEIQRKLKIPLSSLEHHIDYMVRHQAIIKEREGAYTRFFAEQPTQEELELISAFRHEKVREIVAIILEKKDVKFQDLKVYLNIPSSTLSYYLKYLLDDNILTRQQIGHESIYSIKNQNVQKALLMAKSSFTDKLVDKVLRTFMETDFKHVRKQTDTDS